MAEAVVLGVVVGCGIVGEAEGRGVDVGASVALWVGAGVTVVLLTDAVIVNAAGWSFPTQALRSIANTSTTAIRGRNKIFLFS